MARFFIAILTLSYLTACAVSVNDDRRSGGDGERHRARPQAMNKLFLDSINFDAGDSTDWRFLEVGQRGLVTLTCHFDNIQAKTRIALKDAVGNTLATQFHNGEPRQVATAKVRKSRYYVEVTALEPGTASPYSCEAKFEAVVW